MVKRNPPREFASRFFSGQSRADNVRRQKIIATRGRDKLEVVLRLAVYPIISRVLYILGGPRFHQQYEAIYVASQG